MHFSARKSKDLLMGGDPENRNQANLDPCCEVVFHRNIYLVHNDNYAVLRTSENSSNAGKPQALALFKVAASWEFLHS